MVNAQKTGIFFFKNWYRYGTCFYGQIALKTKVISARGGETPNLNNSHCTKTTMLPILPNILDLTRSFTRTAALNAVPSLFLTNKSRSSLTRAH